MIKKWSTFLFWFTLPFLYLNANMWTDSEKVWKYNECTKCFFKETCLRHVKWKICYFSKMSQVTCLNIIHVPYKNMFIWYCNINSYIIYRCCRQQKTLKWKVIHMDVVAWHKWYACMVEWHDTCMKGFSWHGINDVTWHKIEVMRMMAWHIMCN
jgi:hypothetical protein